MNANDSSTVGKIALLRLVAEAALSMAVTVALAFFFMLHENPLVWFSYPLGIAFIALEVLYLCAMWTPRVGEIGNRSILKAYIALSFLFIGLALGGMHAIYTMSALNDPWVFLRDYQNEFCLPLLLQAVACGISLFRLRRNPRPDSSPVGDPLPVDTAV